MLDAINNSLECRTPLPEFLAWRDTFLAQDCTRPKGKRVSCSSRRSVRLGVGDSLTVFQHILDQFLGHLPPARRPVNGADRGAKIKAYVVRLVVVSIKIAETNASRRSGATGDAGAPVPGTCEPDLRGGEHPVPTARLIQGKRHTKDVAPQGSGGSSPAEKVLGDVDTRIHEATVIRLSESGERIGEPFLLKAYEESTCKCPTCAQPENIAHLVPSSTDGNLPFRDLGYTEDVGDRETFQCACCNFWNRIKNLRPVHRCDNYVEIPTNALVYRFAKGYTLLGCLKDGFVKLESGKELTLPYLLMVNQNSPAVGEYRGVVVDTTDVGVVIDTRAPEIRLDPDRQDFPQTELTFLTLKELRSHVGVATAFRLVVVKNDPDGSNMAQQFRALEKHTTLPSSRDVRAGPPPRRRAVGAPRSDARRPGSLL